MKANVLHGIGDLRYEEIAIPDIEKDEVLINVKACGICGSDINRVFNTGTYNFPTVIGHEFSGVIVDSKNFPQLNGKRVGVFPLKPCFKCPECSKGNYEMCTNYDYLGSRCNGGFEEFVSVPAWNIIELPDYVSFEEAAMLEPTSVAIHALRRLNDITDKVIAIIGSGTIGNILVQVAHIMGAKRVIMIGRTQKKLELSKILGADDIINIITQNPTEIINKLTDNIGVDIVIEGTGVSTSLSLAINIVKSSGEILLLGNPSGNINIDKSTYWQILRRQLIIKGSWNSSFGGKENDWSKALSYMADKKLKLLPIISHQLPFDSLLEGLLIMRNPSIISNKIMLVNNE